MSEPQQKYLEDVFGRGCVSGLFDIRDFENVVMPEVELRAFIIGAERIETTDPATGWKAIAYVKGD